MANPSDNRAEQPVGGRQGGETGNPTGRIEIGEIDPLDQLFSIDMVEADLTEILRLIGEQAGLNIIVSSEVQATVTANLDNVTVRSALDVILKTNGFNYFFQENIIVVKPAGTEMVGELETEIFKLDYINSEDLSLPLASVLTPRGKLESFKRIVGKGGESKAGPSNVAVVSDVHENFPRIRSLIKELDVAVPQVNVAVKFIETTLDTSEEMGINWSPSPLSLGPPDTLLGTRGFPLKLNNFTMATLNPIQLTSALNFLRGRGKSKLLSSPQITTLDNQEAEFEVVTTVLIERLQLQTGSPSRAGGAAAGGTGAQGFGGAIPFVSLEEKDIGIKMTVTPRVNEGGFVTMVIQATVEALLSSAEIETERPKTSKRSAQTQVIVADGETVIIGGLMSENNIESTKKVPILGDIPVLGVLFRSKKTITEKRELLIFITPTIVG